MKIIGGTVLKNSGSKFMTGNQKYHFYILLTFDMKVELFKVCSMLNGSAFSFCSKLYVIVHNKTFTSLSDVAQG